MQRPHENRHGGHHPHTPMMPFTPITSIRRELAIMFSFIGLSIVTMATYWVFWQFAQKRNAAKELARREAFAARERAAANISDIKNSHNHSSSSGSNDQILNSETSARVHRNGNSDGGLGFGVREDLVV